MKIEEDYIFYRMVEDLIFDDNKHEELIINSLDSHSYKYKGRPQLKEIIDNNVYVYAIIAKTKKEKYQKQYVILDKKKIKVTIYSEDFFEKNFKTPKAKYELILSYYFSPIKYIKKT